ncbi:MAG: hypothetical protein HPY57_06195 [Ignavibacteria bacterium]|nr:hypothetical protein [Ignavibacteria bacterium]
MKKMLLLSLFILIFTQSIQAQWGLLRRMGIGGGVNFGILSPSLQNLNNELKKFDLPEFDKPIFGFGGGGNLVIGGIRIGGYGIGGSAEKNSHRTLYNNTYNTKTKIDYGLGFGTIGYEIYHQKKFSVNIDLGIGGGSLDLYISDRNSDYNSWDETLQLSLAENNITKKLTYSFFSLQPSLNFEYIYGNFLKFFVSGDYNLILNDEWSKDDELKLVNVPKMNFNGFSIRLGAQLGFYF